MLHSPGPIIVNLGSLINSNLELPLRWYGLLTGLGFIVALLVISKLSENKLSEPQKQSLQDLLFWCFIGGIIGARLWFVMLSFSYFTKNPLEVFSIWQGGQSIQGGFVGGLISAFIFQKYKSLSSADGKLPLAQIFDWAAIAMPIGQAIGRWGNFFNIEAFGKPTALPWGLYVPPELRPAAFSQEEAFHPTFAYECIYLLAVSACLWFLYRNNSFKKGTLFCLYLILYSCGRFFLEFLRLDSLLVGQIPAAQITCLATIIVALGFSFWLKGSSQEANPLKPKC